MKSYFHHDPELDRGKAAPKPMTFLHYEKSRFWVDGGSPRPTIHNSRTRLSKKLRIQLRDGNKLLNRGIVRQSPRRNCRAEFRAAQIDIAMKHQPAA